MLYTPPMHVAASLAHVAVVAIFLVKATLILLGAVGVAALMRRSAAAARHLVWLVALGVLLIAPVLTLWAPLHVRLPVAESVITDMTAAPSPSMAVPQTRTPSSDGASRLPVPRAIVAPAPSPATAPAVLPARQMSVGEVLIAVWATVALLLVLSLAFSGLALRRIVRASDPVTCPDWLRILWEVADRLGLDETPRLLRSGATTMPFACGVLHPTIVLPLESDEWTPDRRRAVLLHELAHVRRHDLLGHTLGRLVCAAYWFHPLAWTAARRLRSESEQACDDLALACGTQASDYAEHLLEIVTSVRIDRTPLVALAMARRKEFEGRMLAILDPGPRRTTAAGSRWRTVALVAPLALLFVFVGAASPVPRTPTQPALRATARTAVAPQVAVPAIPHSDVDIPRHRDVTSDPRTVTASRIDPRANPPSDPRTDLTGAPVGASLNAVARALRMPRPIDEGGAIDVRAIDARRAMPGDQPVVLAKVLGSDPSASVRRVAAWSLARFPHAPESAPALANALAHDADAGVREMAVWALAESRSTDPTVQQAVRSAIQRDASPEVRATAVWAAGNLRDVGAVDALVGTLGDRNAELRGRAAWALGRIRPARAPHALIEALGDSNAEVRKAVAWALFEIRDPAAGSALQSALGRETVAELRIFDVRALVALTPDSDAGATSLQALIHSSDSSIRAETIRALSGDPESRVWPWPWPEPRPDPEPLATQMEFGKP